MLDFDEILFGIKNPQIKKYLEEAIKSYQVGNYRSAIIAVWIATMFDLVKKFEALAEQREPTVVRKWQDLKPIIEAHGNWEIELIRAAKAVDMVSRYELDKLESLSKTRNHYAHPSFDEVGSLFDPTPEEVRYFIRELYEIVLSQPAQLGAFYVNQLLDSIKSSTFFFDQPLADELTNLKDHVIEKINRINSRQIPRLVKAFFGDLNSPASKEHELNILCFLVNMWGAKAELQLSVEISTYWNEYIINHEISLNVLEGTLNYPECINELSEQAQTRIGSAFKSQFLKRERSSESAVKFLAAADIVPLAQSILNDVPSLLPLKHIIDNSSYYKFFFGDNFSRLFGKDIFNETRQALRTRDGYAVRRVLSVLRDCEIWAIADTLSPVEQKTFGSELISSIYSNNYETMSLLSFNNRKEIPIKWAKLLFDQWSDELSKNLKTQKWLFTYREYYLGLFERYTSELDDYTKLGEIIQILGGYDSENCAELLADETLGTFWQKLLEINRDEEICNRPI